MAAIQAMLNSQKAAIDVTVNAARDNVNANVDADAAALAGVVNAARDNVKADTTAQLATQTTAINSNTDTKTGAVTTAVNAKGVVKSIQRGIASPNGASGTQNTLNIAISAVDFSKSQVIVSGVVLGAGNNPAQHSARLTSATNLEVTGFMTSTSYTTAVYWQVIEFF
ncbi:hypothetical protein [Rheinheimera sp.]|uniref:hypothetical protein n=1 Tax=Rheinheimera sp. TaxID=1869214 RepID=UPI003D276A23